MPMGMKNYANIDEYLANFEGETRQKLDQIRQLIKEIAPAEAKEKIAYGIPTFTYHGNLVHFAGYKTHIGFYPGSAPISQFADELKAFNTAKGTVQFPIDKPLPIDIIRRMVLACVERNLGKRKSRG